MDQQIWGDVSIEDGAVRYFTLGNLHLWLKYHNKEVWIAHGYSDNFEKKPKADAPPKNHDWSRWAHKLGSGSLKILPVFPDMPLMVHSEYELKVSPQTHIQIFTRIPVWVRICLSKNNYVLVELPTIKLSRTWFGSPVEGELCYHATTKARRDLARVEQKPYLVSCPISITNKSEGELNFERFCFRVERLSMFEHASDLWADETEILYQGGDSHSEVIMTGKLPKGMSRKNLLTQPRKKIKVSLATRTFKRFFRDLNLLGH
jgi:hypothetical protein